MTYRGHIQNGVAILDTPISLPDGTRVRVEVERVNSDFWQNASADDLARQQGIESVQDIAELRGDWPEADSIDDFLGFIREARR